MNENGNIHDHDASCTNQDSKCDRSRDRDARTASLGRMTTERHSWQEGAVLKRWSAVLVGGVLVAASLTACGGGDNAGSGGNDGKIVMGFSQVGAESGWRTANTKSVQEAAAAANI